MRGVRARRQRGRRWPARPFPFLPRHLTIVSSLTIGIPGFFLALAPNDRRFQPGFVRRVLNFAVPAGLVAAAATFAAYAAARAEGAALAQARTTATLVLCAVGLWVLSLLARPFTPALVTLEAVMVAALTAVIAVPGFRRFFALDVPPLEVVVTAAGITVAAAFVLEAGRWTVAEYQRDRLADVYRRARRLLAFLARRLHPEGAFGLTITVSLVLLAATGWALGTIVQDVIVGDDAARLDRPALDWFVSHRQPWMTTLAKGVTVLGASVFLIPLVVIVGLAWWWRRRTLRPLMLLSAAYVGSELLFWSVKALTGRARPPDGFAVQHFTGLAFPSGHATQATAVLGMLAALAAGGLPSWWHKVAAWVIAIFVAGVVGATRLYLGAHWLTDVLGGWALGALWLMTLLTVARAFDDLRRPPAATEHVTRGLV